MAASPLSWWNTDSERCQCQAVSYCFISSQPSDISSSIETTGDREYPGHDRLGLGGGQPQLDPQQGRC